MTRLALNQFADLREVIEVQVRRQLKIMREDMFGPAAALIPIGIRTVQGIIVGLYSVGFDTIAFYVASTGT